jgi:hypothetical protein
MHVYFSHMLETFQEQGHRYGHINEYCYEQKVNLVSEYTRVDSN